MAQQVRNGTYNSIAKGVSGDAWRKTGIGG